MLAIIFAIFGSCLASAFSTVLSPVYNHDGELIVCNLDCNLERSMIELCLSSKFLNNAPEDFKPFIEYMFVQPLFTFQDFKIMLQKNLVPLETAHVAFKRFCEDEDDDDFRNALIQYYKSFSVFQDEFVNIHLAVIEEEPSYALVQATFKLVEELGGDYKKLLTKEFTKYALKICDDWDPSFQFCYMSMLESDWITPKLLARILFVMEDFEAGNLLYEKAKDILVDEESIVSFMKRLPAKPKELNPLIMWIVDQPWSSSRTIEALLKCPDFDEVSINHDLIMHEKASFACVAEINWNSYELSSSAILSLFGRIVELIRNDADDESLYEFIASTDLKCPIRHVLIIHILTNLSERFTPAQIFFPELERAYQDMEESTLRQPLIILLYLNIFGESMNEVDLDHLVDFALFPRPTTGKYDVPLWTQIATKILRISFTRGQRQVLMAKTDKMSIFSLVHDVTEYISQLATESLEQSIKELKTAHKDYRKWIPRLPQLGKYEKVFLLLTTPYIERFFYLVVMSISPDFVFARNARGLALNHVESSKIRSLSICHIHKSVWAGSKNKSLETLGVGPMINTLLSYYEEHVYDRWMIHDVAEIVLAYPGIENLGLTTKQIDALQRVLELKRGIKRVRTVEAKNQSDETKNKRARPSQ